MAFLTDPVPRIKKLGGGRELFFTNKTDSPKEFCMDPDVPRQSQNADVNHGQDCLTDTRNKNHLFPKVQIKMKR